MTEAITKIIEVPCDAAMAFDVFVEQITSWWPLGSHSVSAGASEVAQSVTIEPNEGGAIYEIKHDGTRTDWGKVLSIEPGAHITTTWHPGTNVDAPTHLDVRFEDIGAGHCRVTLTHSGWEVWADKADEMRGNYNSGWDGVLGRFQSAI